MKTESNHRFQQCFRMASRRNLRCQSFGNASALYLSSVVTRSDVEASLSCRSCHIQRTTKIKPTDKLVFNTLNLEYEDSSHFRDWMTEKQNA